MVNAIVPTRATEFNAPWTDRAAGLMNRAENQLDRPPQLDYRANGIRNIECTSRGREELREFSRRESDFRHTRFRVQVRDLARFVPGGFPCRPANQDDPSTRIQTALRFSYGGAPSSRKPAVKHGRIPFPQLFQPSRPCGVVLFCERRGSSPGHLPRLYQGSLPAKSTSQLTFHRPGARRTEERSPS
jgi:hypothetical protein